MSRIDAWLSASRHAAELGFWRSMPNYEGLLSGNYPMSGNGALLASDSVRILRAKSFGN